MIISSLVFSIAVSLKIKGKIEQEYDLVKLNALINHGPINITSDADFNNYPLIAGDGSPGTPFLIDNLNITTDKEFGILISGVSVYFIIQNCFIKAENPVKISSTIGVNSTVISNTLDPIGGGKGLYLNYTAWVDIIANNFTSGSAGIYGDNANTLYICNNYFTETFNALDMVNCGSLEIESNLFEENDGDQYVHCFNLEIYDNTWINNNYGLYLGDCDTGTVRDNFFLYNINYGVTLYDTIGIVVHANWFIENNLVGGSQAKDELGVNTWAKGGSGNFWSNYIGSGTYDIDGGTGDPYPIFDSDGDELNEYDEIYVYFTDPYNPDHESDGLPDGYEVQNGLNPLLNDASEDPDIDDLINLEEYKFWCDPQDDDSDDDLILDGYEVYNLLNPLFDDAELDLDGDGLDNLEEFLLGTKANNFDSDNDGMNDYWEDENGLDPLVNDAWDDPDNDFLNNFLEYIYGCSPFNNDTDGDSHIDSWEVAHGTNPNDSSDYPDEIFETVTEESPINFIYVVLSFVALSGLFIFKRRK